MNDDDHDWTSEPAVVGVVDEACPDPSPLEACASSGVLGGGDKGIGSCFELLCPTDECELSFAGSRARAVTKGMEGRRFMSWQGSSRQLETRLALLLCLLMFFSLAAGHATIVRLQITFRNGL